MLDAAPVFLSILKLILSHIARYAPSDKFQNSLKIQVQNYGTYSFTIAKFRLSPFLLHKCHVVAHSLELYGDAHEIKLV